LSSGFLARVAGLLFAAEEEARPGSSSDLEQQIVHVFEQLRAPVLRYLLSLRISAADAEEIVQEAFLLLFQHLSRGGACPSPQGWIFRTAHNLALKCRTRMQRERDQAFGAGCLDEIAEDATPGPEEQMQLMQEQTRLLAVVRALPEQDQCCLSLRAEGLRYREIAEVLGISLGAVSISLQRSLARLARAVSH
jgi:RNA polymerase sigma-70 factor, ECF subfamily